jgi:hypothetical protein
VAAPLRPRSRTPLPVRTGRGEEQQLGKLHFALRDNTPYASEPEHPHPLAFPEFVAPSAANVRDLYLIGSDRHFLLAVKALRQSLRCAQVDFRGCGGLGGDFFRLGVEGTRPLAFTGVEMTAIPSNTHSLAFLSRWFGYRPLPLANPLFPLICPGL